MDQLVTEICEICTRVEPDVKASSVLRRLQFMGYEFAATVRHESATAAQKLDALNDFFFGLKEFAVPVEPLFHDPLSLHLINRVLNTRIGSSRALAVIYRYLGEQIGLQFDFVDLHPNCYLKYVENGISRFIDFGRRGKILSSEEVIQTLQSRASTSDAAKLCERVGLDEYIVDYLMILKSAFAQRSHLEPLLMIQNLILDYQPANTNVIAERAVLFNQLGHFRNALTDLKRYFSFSDRQVAPAELVNLFDELNRKFQQKPLDTSL